VWRPVAVEAKREKLTPVDKHGVRGARLVRKWRWKVRGEAAPPQAPEGEEIVRMFVRLRSMWEEERAR
jgi:hypothetical protein